jgi:DNA segregation ATPase FtsK/SpoIIIE, S-DNA-T family
VSTLASRRKTTARDADALRSDVAAVALTTFGALILAALISYSYGSEGVLTSAVAKALLTILGIGAYGIPVIAFGMAVVYVIDSEMVAAPRLLIGSLLLFLCVLIGMHLRVDPTVIWEREILQTHGGYIGAAGSWAFRVVLGPVASYILLAGIVGVAVVLLTQMRLAHMFSRTGRAAGNGFRVAKDGVHSVIQQRRLAQEATDKAPRKRRTARERPDSRVDLDETGENKPSATGATAPETAVANQSSAPSPAEPETGSESAAIPEATSREAKKHALQMAMVTDEQLFQLPPTSILTEFAGEYETAQQRTEATDRLMMLEDTLRSFGIDATVSNYYRGPVITRYEVELERGIRVNQVTRLADNIAMVMAATQVRIEAPIPGKSAIGIEVPNQQQSIVGLRGIVESPDFANSPYVLPIALGRNVAGEPVIADLVDMPHLLVAGATNSGKSVCLHAIIMSFLMQSKPHEVRFIMVDPKRVELSRYDGIPHLMAPVVHSVSAACDVMRKAIREMEKRYDQFAKVGAASIAEYNIFTAGARAVADQDTTSIEFIQQKMDIDEQQARRVLDMLHYGDVVEKPDAIGDDWKVAITRGDERCLPMPRVVIVIDELADLMMQARAEFEFSICRIAQLARATGIHLVIATQRPSVKVLTGNIKANIPSRIALAVASQVDSRVVLDEQGAERLIGRGDTLFAPLDVPKPQRLQGSFVPREDIEHVAEFLREQGEPSFTIIPQEKAEGDDEDFASELDVSDDLYAAAVQYVVAEQEASVSMLQRRFKVGYARAGRLIDAMEQRGVVGPHEGPKARLVLIAPGMAEAALSGTLPMQDIADEADAANAPATELPDPQGEPEQQDESQ